MKSIHSNRLTVSFMTQYFGMGGVEQFIASLCRWLDPDRFKVVSVNLSFNPSGESIRWFPKNVDFRCDPPDTDIAISWGYTDLRQKIRGLKSKIVDVQHGTTQSEWQKSLASEAKAAHLEMGAHVVSVCNASLVNFDYEFRQKVKVLPNGADPDRVIPLQSKEMVLCQLGIPEGTKIAMYLGRVAEDKNVQILIDAVEKLDGWIALIVGPPDTGILKLNEKVVTVDYCHQIGNILQIADVMVHPSDHEAHSISVNEAWLARVPVISCSYRSNLDMEKAHGKMMNLLPVRPTAEAVADAILQPIDHVAVMRAFTVALKYYTAEAMGRRWSDFLWDICRE